jgi:H+/Cl- antiporter ClcA
MTAMFAASLLSIFMGLSIGAEGPSVLIGSAVGDGVSSSLRRDEMIRRYQITGGACAGLAVASNAPLTGMVFAFEEAHKRFTPEVFICAFSSVIFGMLTRTAIYGAFGMKIQSSFHSYVFNDMPAYYYGYVMLVGIMCGLLGTFFHQACLFMRRIFRKIQAKDIRIAHGIRIMIAVLLGGAVSMLAAGVMGGGHELIESMGTKGGLTELVTESVFGLPIAWTLLIILVLKLSITTVNVGAGLPCGIFIPIIAIGACLGGVFNRTLLYIDASFAPYCDLLIMICMAAFFAAVIRAPITAIVMICEFTGSFAALLPVIIAVCIGYCIGEMSRTEGIYEELLEEYENETGIKECEVNEIYTIPLATGAIADKRAVRDVLWPVGAKVTELARGEERIAPDGKTVLHGGDILTIVCRTDDPKRTKDDLEYILG